MKDFDYYRGKDIDIPYPNRSEYEKQLRKEIEEARMTTKERQEALEAVKKKGHAWFFKALEPYNAAMRPREEEFWVDARKELEYEDYLSEKAISSLEHQAYEDGHHAGHSEVYSCLNSLVGLAETIAKNPKPVEPVVSTFVGVLTLDSGEVLEVRRLAGGALVGLDGSWLEQLGDDEQPNNPYDAGTIFVSADECCGANAITGTFQD